METDLVLQSLDAQLNYRRNALQDSAHMSLREKLLALSNGDFVLNEELMLEMAENTSKGPKWADAVVFQKDDELDSKLKELHQEYRSLRASVILGIPNIHDLREFLSR